jgi:hypothetical protein
VGAPILSRPVGWRRSAALHPLLLRAAIVLLPGGSQRGLRGFLSLSLDEQVCDSESEARSKAEAAATQQRLDRLAEQAGGGSKVTLNNINPNWDDDTEPSKLNVILKGDTSGSVEAIKAALSTLPQDKVVLRFLMASVRLPTVSPTVSLPQAVSPSPLRLPLTLRTHRWAT